MRKLVVLNLLCCTCAAFLASEALRAARDSADRATGLELRNRALIKRVENMDVLLKKMAKGLGYDGPDYWH